MKVITEAVLRLELRADDITQYQIPEGKILSPAAREYLQERKIKICKPNAAPATPESPAPSSPPATESAQGGGQAAATPRFVDYETGGFYMEKPEHMTHLVGNVLVSKHHPRIAFRGKVDSLEAQIVLTQATLAAEGANQKLIDDLGDILRVITLIMRSDVLDLPLENETILGMTNEEIHLRSHNPKKYYNIKQLLLPDYSMGKEYALINQIRALVREAEVMAVEGFYHHGQHTHNDIVTQLNRLSSCLHLMGCMHLAGEYETAYKKEGTS